MANTLNVNSLPEYIEQHKDELLVKAIAGAKTLDYVEIMLGVKHKDALNYIDSTVEIAEGACGWNPQGEDTFTQRYIEVNPLSVQKEFCWLDFKDYFMNYQLQFEAGRATLPFEQKIAESNLNAIKAELEDEIWNGGAIGDGFLAQVAADGANDKVEFAEGATITAKVDAMVAALTAGMLKKGVNIFMSLSDYRSYILEANAGCCAGRPVIDAASADIKYVGDSRITLVPVAGLEGTGKMVAATPDALVYGTDIENSENVYEMRYNAREKKFEFDVLFNGGTAVKYVDEVILGE